jgi:diacylglycerol kinase (ATP)
MKESSRSTSRISAFRHAFSGWWYVLRTQRNAWIHAFATCVVIMLGIILKIEWQAWATLFLAIGLVWTAEFVNTALEALVDLASPEMHPLARVGKDVGAAAVLIAALIAVLIGLFILGPPLFEVLQALR